MVANKSVKTVRLGDICSMQSGGTPRRGNSHYYGGGIPWVKIGDIDKSKGKPITKTEEYITSEGLNAINNRLFPKGILLLAMYGSVGKTAFTGIELSTNQAILGIKINNEEKLSYSFLKYWFDVNKAKIAGGARGATLKNISATIVKNIKIPLPPLDQQKHIAKVLDKADALRQKNKELLQGYNDLQQAIFIDMFGDPVANPMGWEVKHIRDIVSEVKYGTSSKAEDSGEYPYLRMNNITYGGEMNFDNLKYINVNEHDFIKYSVRKGDLLFNRTNSIDLVGKTAVFKEDTPMIIAGYLIRVRANELANTEYVSAYLNSKYGKLTLKKLCKSIVGMANINAQELQGIKIPLPPIALQDQYRILIENIEKQKEKAKESLEYSEELFGALVQGYFG